MKISDKDFLAILRVNGGIFAKTARAIREQLGVEITRQAVRDRALKHPDELADIEEETADLAEQGLHELLRSDNEAIRFRAIDLYLKTKGRKRGYVEGGDPTPPKTFEFKFEGYDFLPGDRLSIPVSAWADKDMPDLSKFGLPKPIVWVEHKEEDDDEG